MNPRRPRPARKRPNQYHHGDLRHALLHEAVRTIQARGADGLTLREVGKKLGVSRTALYRHFADKQALLAAVAEEGFRTLRTELLEAWESGARTLAAFDAMGTAYVRFAVAHPSHYRVMFGGLVDAGRKAAPALGEEATNAFHVLVNALAELQQNGHIRRDDPIQLARFIWAVVHGIAMLAIDGQLGEPQAELETLVRFAIDRLHTGIRALH